MKELEENLGAGIAMNHEFKNDGAREDGKVNSLITKLYFIKNKLLKIISLQTK